jgi:hypothetical protein
LVFHTTGKTWIEGVFENRILRRVCGSKQEEVIGRWRRLHNEELHNLYSPPNIIRMIDQTEEDKRDLCHTREA